MVVVVVRGAAGSDDDFAPLALRDAVQLVVCVSFSLFFSVFDFLFFSTACMCAQVTHELQVQTRSYT